MNGSPESILNSPALKPATLAEVLRRRATRDGDRIAYTFLADGAADVRSVTWAQLDQRAAALGGLLREAGAPGERVLLALASGLPFIESLFGCWYANATAVPVSLPRHHRGKHRLDRIVDDAAARFAIATPEVRRMLWGDAPPGNGGREMRFVAPDAAGTPPDRGGPLAADVRATEAPAPAVLQYTSGSTGTPRGVVVTHSNLLANSGQIADACGHGPKSTIAGWLPLFHDMGLVGLVIQAAVSGARCVLMPPERFLMRPWLWLRMICDYRACSSPAPNFAYDLCVDRVGPEHKAGLDLSCWRNALNGSEPVRPATLDRFAKAFAGCGFRRTAFFPCYGLAESTLFVTGPQANRQVVRCTARGDRVPDNQPGGHVGCGRTYGDTRLLIVDPKTARPLPERAIGEIWVHGDSCAAGYWNDGPATAATFGAKLAPPTDDGRIDGRSWLRTGDLGFRADGELFITGRLRELIIIAGRNHFPVDLERTVESAEPGVIAPSGVAAFSIDCPDAGGMERLIVVAEVRREFGRAARADGPMAFDPEAVRRAVRAAVAAEHDVMPHDVVLLGPGALPRTTSGKVSRASTRAAYLDRTLERFEGLSHAYANV